MALSDEVNEDAELAAQEVFRQRVELKTLRARVAEREHSAKLADEQIHARWAEIHEAEQRAASLQAEVAAARDDSAVWQRRAEQFERERNDAQQALAESERKRADGLADYVLKATVLSALTVYGKSREGGWAWWAENIAARTGVKLPK